jgi:hypothetical protein
LVSLLVNWLASWGLFLDQTKRKLSREYGSKSAEYTGFERAANEAFDSSTGYRVCSGLRNWTLHNGLPGGSVHLIQPRLGAPANWEQEVVFTLQREDLLADGKRDKLNRVVVATLESLPPQIELMPLIADAMEAFRSLDEWLLDLECRVSISGWPTIREALDLIGEGEEGQPAVMRIAHDGDGSLVAISFDILPAHRDLLDRAHASAKPSDVLRPVSRPTADRPNLDTPVLRAMDSGVELISAWMSEGGATPEFIRRVAERARQDNGVENTIVGTINCALVLAYRVSGAVGASAETIVAGLPGIDDWSYRPPKD